MSGECVGVSGGVSVGWPGCDGSGVAGAGVVGGSSGCCCMNGSPRSGTRLRTVSCFGCRVAHPATPVIGPATSGVPSRGGIGRRGRFRSCCRKMWGFESLRAHQFRTEDIQWMSEYGIPPRTRFHRDFGNVSIKTVETQNEGLKRAFMLTIPAKDIEARVDQEVKRIAPQVRIPGFRPGKVPPNLIKKMHGDALQRDALNGAVQDGVQQVLTENNVRPALQPQVELDEKYEPGKDAEVRVSLEALPEIPAAKIDGLTLESLTVCRDE